MKRVAWACLLGCSLVGCYESHLGTTAEVDGGGELCGAIECGLGDRCCDACGEPTCVTEDLPCPDVCPSDECASSSDCAPGEFCSVPPGACGAVGVCQPRPTGCFSDCPGVCGCDGATHCNACEAARAGVGVLHSGPCETTMVDRFAACADLCEFGDTFCMSSSMSCVDECVLALSDCTDEVVLQTLSCIAPGADCASATECITTFGCVIDG